MENQAERGQKRVVLCTFCGWPLSGKSTIAERVAVALGLKHLDINLNVRVPIFGLPTFSSYKEFEKQDREEMLASYELLFHAADIFLRLGRSVVLSATFSRVGYQESLVELQRRFPSVKKKVIWCRPTNDSEDEINRRLERRRSHAQAEAARGCLPYTDPANSIERYYEVKGRFHTIDPELLPHLEIDTSPPQTTDFSVEAALAYLRT